jgi:hypothetical protein
MKFYKVDVDEEVFRHVQQFAEPLVDSFNAALRKALKLGNRQTRSRRNGSDAEAGSIESDFSPGVPQALRQVLEVAMLVRKGWRRADATRSVAESHNVAVQTVNDKYGRQLGLTAAGFEELLRDSERGRLVALLKKRFPRYEGVIEGALLEIPPR